MMFAKTICTPGSYVEVIPQGLLAELQYNSDGLLEKIILELQDNPLAKSDIPAKEADPESFRALAAFVPNTIPLKGGTTWVYGVFYTDNIPTTPGSLPYNMIDDYLKLAVNGEQFRFYGGLAQSGAASFKGSLSIRNWLGLAKFTVLPGIVVPIDMTEDTMNMMMTTGNYSFMYPYIAGYITFNSDSHSIEYSGLRQCTVENVTTFLDDFGYYKATLDTDDGKYIVNYSDVAAYNIQKGSLILYYNDEYFNIVGSTPTEHAEAHPVSNTVTCPVCNKKYRLPEYGPVTCDDPHCLSTQYGQVVRMLDILKLPSMTPERYKQACNDHEITCVTDVLVLPEYADVRPEVSLSDAIRSIVPIDVCASEEFFTKLAASCNQSVDSLMYYVTNPIHMETDLNMTSVPAKKLIAWLSDNYNVLSLQTILTAVSVSGPKQTFDGPPIFRNTSFVLTGKFKRGPHSYIASVIRSYSGDVTDIDSLTRGAVIVGSMQEDIEGRVINIARRKNIKCFDEDQFFAQYEIDQDLAKNLL